MVFCTDLICLPLSYSDYGVTGGYLWGVGFYPEDYLPYTPGITGGFREVDSLVAVAHTMAHNWFAEIGNNKYVLTVSRQFL